jgi:hypothetical protein
MAADPVATSYHDAPSTSRNVGETVGSYTLLHPVGGGAFGNVWMGRHCLIDTYRAVKVIPRNDLGEVELAGIRRYLSLTKQHDHLLPIEECGIDGESYYYTMPLADDAKGEATVRQPDQYEALTLQRYLELHKPLPIDRVLTVARHLLQALTVLHDAGFLHCDVKPANIVRHQGIWKLVDMGILVRRDQADGRRGTPWYLPPEGALDRTADLYAVGKILFLLATGRERGDFAAFLNDQVKIPGDDRRRQALQQIIRKACHPDPQARYLTAQEMYQAIYQLVRPVVVELILDEDAQSYSDEQFQQLVEALRQKGYSVRPKGYGPSNSVRVQLELMPDEAERLAAQAQAGEWANWRVGEVRLEERRVVCSLEPPSTVPLRGLRAAKARKKWIFVLPAALTGLAALIGFVLIGHLGRSRPEVAEANLKKIGAALHRYDAENGRLPAANANLSWRVALLPYLGQDHLYQQFHHDEPWNSPHNLGLLQHMPSVYRDPRTAPEGYTPYRVFTGMGVFGNPEASLAWIKEHNGLANTILVVEAGEAVPWTRPEELIYQPERPLPPLGVDDSRSSFVALFADESVRRLELSTPGFDLQRAITGNNQPPQPEKINGPPPVRPRIRPIHPTTNEQPPARPRILVLEPGQSRTTSKPTTSLAFQVLSESQIQGVRVLLDGKEIEPGEPTRNGKALAYKIPGIALKPGLNVLTVHVRNNGGKTSASQVVSYLPPPVRVHLEDRLQDLQRPDRFYLINELVPTAFVQLRGWVEWPEGKDNLFDRRMPVRVWVNGFKQPGTVLQKPDEGSSPPRRRFTAPLHLNRPVNKVEVDFPADLKLDASSATALTIRCPRPKQDQRLHLFVLAPGQRDSKEVADRILRSFLAKKSEGNTFRTPVFKEGRLYGPLVGNFKRDEVYQALSDLKRTLQRSTGKFNEVVIVYFQGEEIVHQGKHYLLTEESKRGRPDETALPTETILARLNEMPGAKLLLLDVRSKSAGTPAVARSYPHVGFFRYAWRGEPGAPVETQFLAALARSLQEAGDLKEVSERMKGWVEHLDKRADLDLLVPAGLAELRLGAGKDG